MTSSAPACADDARDNAITAERIETKYFVESARLAELSRALKSQLTPHRFTGEAANRLPGAQHFVTTIYFDTSRRAYFAAARSNEQSNSKIRAKEYYDVHPALVELASTPEQLLRYQPWVWFELKQRAGVSTTKRRFRFPKAQAAQLFDGVPTSQDLGLEQPGERADAAALIAHVTEQGEPIAPSALVNYRRLAFQSDDATLRVTVDLGLAFYKVPADLWSRTSALSHFSLGEPVRREARAILEVKRRGPLPGWLENALLQASSGPVPFSKFVAASEAVAGAP